MADAKISALPTITGSGVADADRFVLDDDGVATKSITFAEMKNILQPLDDGLTDISGLAVTDGNILVGDGTNWVAESGATARASLGLIIGTDVLANIVEDTTPQLGGQLDVNGQAIGDGTRELLTFVEDASAVNHVEIENEATGGGPIIRAAGDDTNVDLNVKAKGTGNIAVGNFTFDGDQTVGASQDNFVLTYDDATGLISLEASLSGGIDNVVEDTTPQLGGDLDVNGNDITSPDGTDLIDIVNGTITIQTASSSRLDITDTGVRMGGANARVTTILDEDTMASDSATALATQQSIKAYVDAGDSGGLDNVVEDTTPQLGGDLDANGFWILFDDLTGIKDSSGNEMLVFDLTAMAVNYVTIQNSITGQGPTISAAGDNTNVDLKLAGKGTGVVTIGGSEVVTLAGTQTLTNKTLTLPTIGDFTNATHNHESTSGGAKLDHGNALLGLTDDDHSQYALLAGRSGGQSLTGGTASGDDITLKSTSNVTKGQVIVDDEAQFNNEAHFGTEVDNGNSGASDTIDWTAGNKQKSTLTGNVTYSFTDPGGACSLILKLVQDATGSRTATWPASVKWPGGTAPTLSTGANAVDIVSFYFDGTNYYGQSGLDFS